MTTTNRAFIKAYRSDEAQPSPGNPTIGGASRSQPHAMPAAVAVATTTTRANTSVSSSPAAPAERSAIYGPRPTPQAAKPKSAGAAREKRPLSSFIASTGIARLDTEPADGDFFRPGTTVASFHWPDVCRRLSRQCGEQLGRVADLLATHATAGRSLVAVIGISPRQGTTTVAISLAARLAERRRTVLVDANFRAPRLAEWLEVEPTAGWQDVLKHGSPLPDAVIRAADDRLDLLALGAKMPKDVERLASGLQAVVTAGVLRHAYEHVILDAGAFHDAKSPPIALELTRNMGIDAAIAVTSRGDHDPSDVDALADHLARSGCEFLGAIENRCAV